MKKILFVINTMGMGGGEKSILQLLKQIDLSRYHVSLFVLTGQGELINQVPDGVRIINRINYPISVLDHTGKKRLIQTVIKAMFRKETIKKRIPYIIKNFWVMIRNRRIKWDKLLWKIISDGAQTCEGKYDLAVAYLEGGAAYYVSSYVNAEKKVAFIHTDYSLAGYTRRLDEDCYLEFDRIFTVSENTKESFLSVYPECRVYTGVFYNLIDREEIINKAKEPGGFSDRFEGFRILTVGRLVPEKAHDIEIDAMQILKQTEKPFRWYVLGEGTLRNKLEEQIRLRGLQEDYILLGAVDNPFPYYVQSDLYVQASYLEGKSVAIQEAQVLGCAILVSDYCGVREQVTDGVDGKICKLTAESLAENILNLAENVQLRAEYGRAAAKKEQVNNLVEVNKLLKLLE